MRLLIVEDDAALREILAKRLMQERYAVDESGDGNEGLQYALNTPYDGLILDIMLPGIDGLTLLKHLRARGASCGVLLLTARDENGFCYLDAEGLRGSTLFWGAKLVGLAYLAAAFLRCSWTLSYWKQETPKEELKTLLLLALAPAAGFLLQGWLPGRGLLCCGITLGLVCVYVLVLQPHRGAAVSGKRTALLPPSPQPLAALPHDGHGSLQAHQR